MIELNTQFLTFFEVTIFLASVAMHIARKNSRLLLIYALQSLAIVGMLLVIGINNNSNSLVVVAIITLLVKVFAASRFFSKFIDKKQLNISTSAYLTLPITLTTVLLLTIFVKSSIFTPIVSLFPGNAQLIALSLAGILISLFMVINRKGIFAQLIGILSFENGLVAFGTLTGLEQSFAIEVGILFDILLWILISSIMVTLVYSHFGTLDTTKMNRLKD